MIASETASIRARGHINSLRPKRPTIIKSEDELERFLVQRLEESGATCRRQVPCNVGIADVITETHVYEIKFRADRRELFTAIGQVLVYRQAINPRLVPVVFVDGERGELYPVAEIARQFGVEVQFKEGDVAASSATPLLN